jgi:hypothetical protein
LRPKIANNRLRIGFVDISSAAATAVCGAFMMSLGGRHDMTESALDCSQNVAKIDFASPLTRTQAIESLTVTEIVMVAPTHPS